MRVQSRIAVALLVLTSAAASAQSADDFAAWTALMQTPVGALPAIDVTPAGTGANRSPVWALRLTNWKFPGASERNNTYAGSIVAPVGTKASLTGTIGYLKVGAGNGTMMLGADLQKPVWENLASSSNPVGLSAAVKASAGYGHFSGDVGYNSLSLVASIPLAARFQLANKSSLSFLASPGFGLGRVSGGSGGVDNGSSTRTLLGFSAAWTSASGVGIHLGTQKVMIENNPPWVTGLSVSFPSSK